MVILASYPACSEFCHRWSSPAFVVQLETLCPTAAHAGDADTTGSRAPCPVASLPPQPTGWLFVQPYFMGRLNQRMNMGTAPGPQPSSLSHLRAQGHIQGRLTPQYYQWHRYDHDAHGQQKQQAHHNPRGTSTK